ncbi:MAG: metallophosphoesterase, partial [Alphaproteobacteria bacterium]|nr:metallophosphoesterase [Alphaproteobacteria bacterium]
ERLEAMLGRLGKDGAFRIVLLHHPPHEGGASWRKGLRDAAALRSVIARAGAELVLHGHNHEFASAQLAAGTGLARVFGVPSASASRAGKKPQSHYHLYGIERADDGWRMTVTVRGLDPHGLKFAETGTETLKL